jgi:hypothetical protein
VTLVVEFVDTSVLAEILRIPGKSQRPEEIVAQLTERAAAGVRFILPTATIIETGNHVFQVKDGGARRACAGRFVELLRLTARGSAPWSFHRRTWSEELLELLCDGGSTGLDLVEHATSRQLGTGDLSIVTERDLFAEQNRGSGLTVRIWTLEACLNTWAEIPAQRSGGVAPARTARG